MDLKSEDILNVEIDPAILLSYALEDKPNLENISNNIFEEDIPKNDDKSECENDVPSESKTNEISDSEEKYTTKSLSAEDHSCIAEPKLETYSINQPQKQDINGNEELSSYENLSCLLEELELSDSENEDYTDLKERAPERKQSQAKKNRYLSNDLSKNKSSDRSQFNPQSLKFLSVSQVEVHEPNTYDKFTIHPNLTSILPVNETIPLRQDYVYKDAGVKAVGSPESESGYESSSAQSRSSSPPLLSLCMSDDLDFIPETPDEQIIWEFLIENTTDGALTNHNLSTQDSHNKVKEDKIIEIIKYLQDIPNELKESFNVAPLSENIVPLVSNSDDLDPIFASNYSHPVLQSIEMPKKLSYKLNDEAKRTLRTKLSEDKFFDAKRRIYRKLTHDIINHKDVKVIYVEDEKDKGSENRTNLHYAVLDSKMEDIYCLVEIHKQYMKPLKDINIRDKHGKTALDYAIQNKMTLVADYLKENTACQSVNI